MGCEVCSAPTAQPGHEAQTQSRSQICSVCLRSRARPRARPSLVMRLPSRGEHSERCWHPRPSATEEGENSQLSSANVAPNSPGHQRVPEHPVLGGSQGDHQGQLRGEPREGVLYNTTATETCRKHNLQSGAQRADSSTETCENYSSHGCRNYNKMQSSLRMKKVITNCKFSKAESI